MIQKIKSGILFAVCSTISAFGTEFIELEEIRENTPLTHYSSKNYNHMENLPDDPFWKIIFDNEDPLTQTDIYHLGCSSKSLKDRLETLVPKIVLSRFPSVLQCLKALAALEQAENVYQNLFQKYPSQMFYLKGFRHEIERLLKAEPYMHLSPWFKWNLGTQRMRNLDRIHELGFVEINDDWFEKMRCYMSAVTRDPFVFGTIILTSAGVSGLLGWGVYKNEIVYRENYLKSLNYTTTQKFLDDQMKLSDGPGTVQYYAPDHPFCFQTYNFSEIPFTCWNTTITCKKHHLNDTILEDALYMTIETLITTIKKLNVEWGASFPSFSFHDIYNAVSPSFVPYCTKGYYHDSFLNRVSNSTLLMESYIQGGDFIKNSSSCTWNPDPDRPPFSHMGAWAIKLHDYNPECIANKITPQAALDSTITSMFIIQFSVVVMFIIGWSVTF